MYDTTFYYDGGHLKAKTVLIQKGKPKRSILVSEEAANDLIDGMEKEKDKIKSIRFDGQDLVVSFDDFRVRLQNKKLFKMDDRFDFMFKLVKNKKYKINKEGLGKKIIALGLLATMAVVTPIVVKKTIKHHQNSDVSEASSYFDDTNIELSSKNDNEITKEELTSNLVNDNSKTDIDLESTNSEKEETKSSSSDSNSISNSDNNNNINEDIENSNIEHGSLTDSQKAQKTKELYGDIISKYSNMYGLDSNVICAIATQERGVHSDSVDDGGAIGLMQIQVSVWTHETITAYNYETEQNEDIYISLDELRDVDFNVKVGCAIFQNYLKLMNGNYIAAIQCYNMGDGSMRSILNDYSYSSGKSVDEILNDSSDLGWMEYRSGGYYGDPNYVEHVMRYYEGDSLNNSKVR